ncbi:MAG TPA: penicillin-binding protein 1C [Spirochaetia bacterium]|nr:penicillin-binding protein 1C [Spirochaetia bacterium]
MSPFAFLRRRRPVGAAYVFAGFAAAPGVLFAGWMLLHLPFGALDRFVETPFSIEVEDRNGVPLEVLPLADGLFREYQPALTLPPYLVDIFLRSEDARFYIHPGVDPVSMLRAVVQFVASGHIVSGASTITMQLARIVSPEESAQAHGISGKLQEALNALRIEAHLSKSRILDLWLNSIPFGSNVSGVVSASKTYFGAAPSELSVADALLLAVIPRSPQRYNPIDNPVAAAAEASRLAARLRIPVTEQELRNAAEVARTAAASYRRPFETPHFVAEIRPLIAADRLARGTPLRTTIDLTVQHSLEASLAARVTGAAKNRISNGAGLVIDNRTGEVLAWAGSTDFFDVAHSGQIDGVLIRRQPGSAIKPYLYALALDKGFTPATVLPDIPTQFGSDEVYIPENFNRRFNGPVRLRTALASSLNVPAVYTLQRVGVANFVEKLAELGFVSLRGQQQTVGSGLALGNAEVTLYELVRAFSVFPRDGKTLNYRWSTEGATPDILESESGGDPTSASNSNAEKVAPPPEGRQVFSPTSAGLIRDILSDRVGRVTGFGTRSVLNTPFQAMFKTGTSNQFNNIWAVGATGRYTVGVWMGNFSGSTIIGKPGSSLPAAVVVEMLSLLSRPHEEFPPISGVHRVEICALSGEKATANCTATVPEYFPDGVDPPPCDWHRGPGLPVWYPPLYQRWASRRDYNFAATAQEPGLRGTSVKAGDGLSIVHPPNGSVFYFDPTARSEDQALRVEVISDSDEPISVSVNGAFMKEGPSPLAVMVPLRRGSFEISGEQGGTRVSAGYVVR